MYTLFQLLPLRSVLLEQVPAMVVSLVVAEVFYKFHSFTLECLAFLATWYLIDGASRFVGSRLSNRSGK